MGCGSSSRPYKEKDLKTYLDEQKLRYPSAEYVDGKIQLKTLDGFFNSSSLLDSTWLQGKLTNQEYHQAIEHINQRVSQVCIGASKHLSIAQIPKVQTTLLAIEELNAKYAGRVHFTYQYNQQENSVNPSESYLILSFN